jgi:hypothetical protein
MSPFIVLWKCFYSAHTILGKFWGKFLVDGLRLKMNIWVECPKHKLQKIKILPHEILLIFDL